MMIHVREQEVFVRLRTLPRLCRRRHPVRRPLRNLLFHLSGRQKTTPRSTLPEVSNRVEWEDSNRIRSHNQRASFSPTEALESFSKSLIESEPGETSIIR